MSEIMNLPNKQLQLLIAIDYYKPPTNLLFCFVFFNLGAGEMLNAHVI